MKKFFIAICYTFVLLSLPINASAKTVKGQIISDYVVIIAMKYTYVKICDPEGMSPTKNTIIKEMEQGTSWVYDGESALFKEITIISSGAFLIARGYDLLFIYDDKAY